MGQLINEQPVLLLLLTVLAAVVVLVLFRGLWYWFGYRQLELWYASEPWKKGPVQIEDDSDREFEEWLNRNVRHG